MVDLGIQVTSNSCSFAQKICINFQFPDVDLECSNLVPAQKVWVCSSDGEIQLYNIKICVSVPTAFCYKNESSQLESEKLHIDFYALSC